MNIMVENLNVIIRRDKPNQHSPCDDDWLNYDYNVWKSAIDELECRHPLWRNQSYPLCSNKEAMQKGRPPDFEDLESVLYDLEQLKIIEKRLHSNKIRNHYYFSIILLVITFIAPLGALNIYKSEVLILLASLMYMSKPK